LARFEGKSVVVTTDDSTERLFISSIVAYVGVNPRDLHWITTRSAAEAMQTFVEGKAEAFLGFAPQPQELRANKVGRVILDTLQDRPWSQYFCCMTVAHREFVRKSPVATKRALRAMLKATDICAIEPDRAAQSLMDKDVTTRYDYALQTMKDVLYDKWRHYDSEDTVRFYALRLQEIGMIKSAPQKLIAQGTKHGQGLLYIGGEWPRLA
jgi:NitT/TauT family transport system substrate-binding protein